MAFFQSDLDGAIRAIVDAIPKAVRTSLYGAANQLLSKARGGALLTGDHLIPVGGLADGNFRFQRLDKTGAAANGEISLLLHEPFEGATVSTPNRLTVATTTFAQAQTASAGLRLNNTSLTTAASAVLVTSNKQFLRTSGSPLLFQLRARANHFANSVMQFGFGLPANQTSDPLNGAYWEITTVGVVQPVWTFNGTSVPGTPVTMPLNWQNNYYQWSVLCNEEEFVFFILDPTTNLLVAEQRIPIANTGPKGWAASHLPAFARLHHITAPATASDLILTRLDVYGFDINQSLPYAAQMAFSGLDGLTNPTSFAGLANIPAAAGAPATGTLAAGTASYTTLGGQFAFAAPTGAETEFPLFGFTVPAPYTFVCTGIDIDLFNTVVAVGATPSVFQWSVVPDAIGAAITTTTHRRIALGVQTLAAAAPVGALAQRISSQFPTSDSPLITSPGRVLIIGVKIPIGVNTATELFRGVVAIKGFFY